jgi:hypothetical protein
VIPMPNEKGSIDIQRLIAEAAVRHKLLFKPDDAAFEIVTMNQLILDDSIERVHAGIRETIAGFNARLTKKQKSGPGVCSRKK